MSFASTVQHIVGHPLNRGREAEAIARYAQWQIKSRLSRGQIVVPFVNDTKLSVSRGMTGATGNIYCGLAEFRSMSLAMHLLRPNDYFFDIGANVGAFTILAASTGASCLSFEPHPAAHDQLLRNVALNAFERQVEIVQACVGRESGSIAITDSEGPMNHVSEQGLTVPLVTLDAYAPYSPTMLKIDVEGFEGEVLEGGSDALDAALAVSIELGPAGERYGWTESAIHHKMRSAGFAHVSYDPFTRRLLEIDALRLDENNTIYVKNREKVQARISQGPPFRVLRRWI